LAKGRGCLKHKEKGGGEELTFLEVRKRYEFEKSKEPRPQGGALKPKFSKPKTEIPKS